MKVIYYDLETTHLHPLSGPNGVQIVQIGAVTCKWAFRQKKLNIYVIPTCRISAGATRAHGLTHEDLLEDEIEYDNVLSLETGLQLFMNFLAEQKDHDDEEVLMVSHNNSAFNLKVLLNNLNKYGILFPSNVLAFDSLVLMREIRNKGKYGNMERLSLDACLEYFYEIDQNQNIEHDALNDAEYCRRICEQGAKELGYGSLRRYFESRSPLHYAVGKD